MGMIAIRARYTSKDNSTYFVLDVMCKGKTPVTEEEEESSDEEDPKDEQQYHKTLKQLRIKHAAKEFNLQQTRGPGGSNGGALITPVLDAVNQPDKGTGATTKESTEQQQQEYEVPFELEEDEQEKTEKITDEDVEKAAKEKAEEEARAKEEADNYLQDNPEHNTQQSERRMTAHIVISSQPNLWPYCEWLLLEFLYGHSRHFCHSMF